MKEVLRCFHCGKTQAEHTDADDKRCPMWGRYRPANKPIPAKKP